MSHDVNRMMYAGTELPWHGIGTQFPANATYEDIAHLFYEARAVPLLVGESNAVVPDRKAIVRSDTGTYLSTVGADYSLIQFKELARVVVDVAQGFDAVFHTAGLLGANGERGWLLGELPRAIRVRGDESEIKKYVLAFTGHDGKTALTFKNTSVRVVCRNTVGAALAEKDGASWTVRHTSGASQRVDEARRAFSRLVASYDHLEELANFLAGIQFNDHQRKAVLDQVIPLPEDGKSHPRILREREKVTELFDSAIGVGPQLRGTAWGAVQAFTEYADHLRPVRGTDVRRARLESTWLGSGSAFKQAAMKAITAAATSNLAAA